jgi:hypothetical protein
MQLCSLIYFVMEDHVNHNLWLMLPSRECASRGLTRIVLARTLNLCTLAILRAQNLRVINKRS